MSLLSSFNKFDFDEGAPSLSVTKNGVTFNKSVVIKLGYPERVTLLISNEEKKIALQACDLSEPKSVQFYKEKENGVLSVRWNSRDLLNTLQHLTGWDLSVESYKADGLLIPNEHAMIFDLSTAKLLT